MRLVRKRRQGIISIVFIAISIRQLFYCILFREIDSGNDLPPTTPSLDELRNSDRIGYMCDLNFGLAVM